MTVVQTLGLFVGAMMVGAGAAIVLSIVGELLEGAL